MHREHKHGPVHGNAGGQAATRGNRGAASRSSRVPLTLAGPPPDRWRRLTAGGVGVSRSHRLVAGQLLVRWERRSDASILWLSGALDRATATLLDRELNSTAIATIRLVVD